MPKTFFLSFLAVFFSLIIFFSCSNRQEDDYARSITLLGERLFFDPILSRDSTVSCASCHKPEFAFADNTVLSPGVEGRKGNRNTPSAMNMTDRNHYFWDGRAASLEEQALGPIENPVEMDLPLSEAIRRLRNNSYYKRSFQILFGSEPTRELLAKAIAEFERTLETSDTPFDDYIKRNDTHALSPSARRGLELFNGKARCFDCHFGVDFTGNDQFRNIGLYNGKDLSDKGRYEITKNPADLGKFKTPGLRNIALTAPYMHNGMHKTLREVIEYYNDPDKFISNSINRDTLMRPLGLTEQEMTDLENFLLALTDRRFSTAHASKNKN